MKRFMLGLGSLVAGVIAGWLYAEYRRPNGAIYGTPLEQKTTEETSE